MGKTRPETESIDPTVVQDWEGFDWYVMAANATRHGFDVLRGFATSSSVRTIPAIILTQELADYLRENESVRIGLLDLPITKVIINRFKRRLGLKINVQRPEHVWTENEIALFGTMKDQDIAQKIGVHIRAVGFKRRALGIAAVTDIVEWTPEKIALLGTASDRDVGKKIGISHGIVFVKRKSLGIDAYKFWTEERISLLGTASARELAALWGTTVDSVEMMRFIHRIKAPPPKTRWTNDKVQLLGTMMDMDLAKIMGITPSAVSHKRRAMNIPEFTPPLWTPENIALLGTMSDADLGQRLGCHKGTVFVMRNQHNIPAFSKKGWIEWTPENLALLGTMPDGDLAKKLGCNPTTVVRMRARHNVPDFISSRWTPEMMALLGNIRDEELALRFGIPLKTVKLKRQTMGIKYASRALHNRKPTKGE